MFNFADCSFGFFFDTGSRITSAVSRQAARLTVSSALTAGQPLRLALSGDCLVGLQACQRILIQANVSLALELSLRDITLCAWCLPLTARLSHGAALRLGLSGSQSSGGQSVLRVRPVERFTN